MANLFSRLLGTAAAAAGTAGFLTLPSAPSEEAYAPFQNLNVAHRGLHSADKTVPENSLAAFGAAAEKGYGIELDVQLSKDGQVVVFHDDTLTRLCGVDQRVDELTYEELSELRLLETSQQIPLFSDVLALVAGRSPFIVELKTGRRNSELCEKTYQLLAAYEGPYCIESFDPTIVRWFKINAPEVVRGQLADTRGGSGQGALVDYALSHCLLNFLGRPNFIAYQIGDKPASVKLAEKLGAKAVAWTSRRQEDVQVLDPDAGAMKVAYDTVIFEFYEPEVRF